MECMNSLGYPVPVPKVLYNFGRYFGYEPPHFDLTYSELCSKVMAEQNLKLEDAELTVLEMLREDFDVWFWKRFGFEDTYK